MWVSHREGLKGVLIVSSLNSLSGDLLHPSQVDSGSVHDIQQPRGRYSIKWGRVKTRGACVGWFLLWLQYNFLSSAVFWALRSPCPQNFGGESVKTLPWPTTEHSTSPGGMVCGSFLVLLSVARCGAMAYPNEKAKTDDHGLSQHTILEATLCKYQVQDAEGILAGFPPGFK